MMQIVKINLQDELCLINVILREEIGFVYVN